VNAQPRTVWRPLAVSIGTSAVVSLAILGVAQRYLVAMVAEEYRTGARTTTGGDSIGLPLGSLALLLGLLMAAVNIIVATLIFRRRRRFSTRPSRPAA